MFPYCDPPSDRTENTVDAGMPVPAICTLPGEKKNKKNNNKKTKKQQKQKQVLPTTLPLCCHVNTFPIATADLAQVAQEPHQESETSACMSVCVHDFLPLFLEGGVEMHRCLGSVGVQVELT